MVTHAKRWATQNGLTRTSAIHGEEEYKIPTDFSFSHTDTDTLTTTAQTEMQVEAGIYFITSIAYPFQGGIGILAGQNAELNADAHAMPVS